MSFDDFEIVMKKFPFLKKLLLEYQDKDNIEHHEEKED